MTEDFFIGNDSPKRLSNIIAQSIPEPKYPIGKDLFFSIDDIEMKESVVFPKELKNLPVIYSKSEYTPTPANTPKNTIFPLISSSSCQISEVFPFIPPAKEHVNDSNQPHESPISGCMEQKADLTMQVFDKNQKISPNPSPSDVSSSPGFVSSNPFEQPWSQQVSSPRSFLNSDSPNSSFQRSSSSMTEIPLNCDEWSGPLVTDIFIIYGYQKIISLHKRLSNPFLEPNSNSRKNAFKLIVKDPEAMDEKVAYIDCPRDVNMNDKRTNFQAVLHRLVGEQLKKNTEANTQAKSPVIEDVSDGEDSIDGEGFRCHYEERILQGHSTGISVIIDPNNKGVIFRVIPHTEDEEGYDKFIDKGDLINEGFYAEGEDLSSIDFNSAINLFVCNERTHTQKIYPQLTLENEPEVYQNFEMTPNNRRLNEQKIQEQKLQQFNQLSNNIGLIQSNIIIPHTPTSQLSVPYNSFKPTLPQSIPSSVPTIYSNSYLFTVLALLLAFLSVMLAFISVLSS